MSAELLDSEGVAVLTGGASGFGLEAATRCASLGMAIAILDMVRPFLGAEFLLTFPHLFRVLVIFARLYVIFCSI
jgi:hypothetical protein